MGSGWTVVAQFAQEAEARLLAGRLDAEGIETRIYPEFQGSYYGESVNLPYGVLVPDHRVLEARAVLARLEAG
jgi:Putative prokaryotic signal transducing protein